MLGLTAAMFSSYAQDFETEDEMKKTPTERAEAGTKKLTDKVGLTADQQTKVRAIILERVTKSDEIRKKYVGNKEAAKSEVAIVHKDAREKIKAILTPEQLTKLKDETKGKKDEAKAKKVDKKK